MGAFLFIATRQVKSLPSGLPLSLPYFCVRRGEYYQTPLSPLENQCATTDCFFPSLSLPLFPHSRIKKCFVPNPNLFLDYLQSDQILANELLSSPTGSQV